MRFKNASNKLDRIASGEHHAIYYTKVTSSDGKEKEECKLYVGGKGHYIASSWVEAFELLNNNGKLKTDHAP